MTVKAIRRGEPEILADLLERYGQEIQGVAPIAGEDEQLGKGRDRLKSASTLSALARAPLWRAGQDYDHGTGHGVGVYLCVHEGPQRLSHVRRMSSRRQIRRTA